MHEKRRIEVRYLTNMDELVTFFELSPGELKQMVEKCPLPEGNTLGSFKITPAQAADWFESAMIVQPIYGKSNDLSQLPI